MTRKRAMSQSAFDRIYGTATAQRPVRQVVGDLMNDIDNRLLAAEARAGGRILTGQIVRPPAKAESLAALADAPQEEVNAFWAYSIDPAYASSGPRAAWRQEALSASGQGLFPDTFHNDPSRTFRSIVQTEAMFDWPIYRAAMPQVYVNVSGGIAEATVTRGDAEVIVQDWDNLSGGGLVDYEREDLEAMREKLSRVAALGYRRSLLADIDEKLSEWDAANGLDCGAPYCVDPGGCKKHDEVTS